MKKNLTFKAFIFIFISLSYVNTMNAQKWDTLAPIPEKFAFPVVVVINDKIHIMGGGGAGGATNHHYAYDPYTNTWEPKAAVPFLAQQPAGAATDSFIHYFGGGYPNSGSPLKKHYAYDAAADSWAPAADLTSPRAIHYGVSLNNVIYSLAGQGVANLCQTYDAASDAWVTKNNLPDNGFWYGAHVVTDGHIYRFCGGGYTAPNKLAHRYDPASDTWTSLTAFPAATHGISGAAIGHKIYLVGGYHDFLERDEVFIFDIETQMYSAGIPLPIGRNYHNTVALNDCIYVLGGNNAIDTTIGRQLIRFCPEETTALKNEFIPSQLSITYSSGNIFWKLPGIELGPMQIYVYDMTGKLIYNDQKSADPEITQELHIGNLVPSVYFIQIKTKYHLYTGAFVVSAL